MVLDGDDDQIRLGAHGLDVDRTRTSLLDERARTIVQVEHLTREFDGIIASAELVATDDEHDPEGHTIAFERQQLAGLLRAARARVVELDDALDRVASGTYGTCEQCRRRIAGERLAALPATRTCIRCAAAPTG